MMFHATPDCDDPNLAINFAQQIVVNWQGPAVPVAKAANASSP